MRPVRAMLASVSAVTALLAAPSLASATIPTGSFEIQFGGKQSIWMSEAGDDAGEEFCASFEAGFDFLEFCDFQAWIDGKGKIYGYFEFTGWSNGVRFDEGGPIKGTQKGDDRSGISRVKLSMKLEGIASNGVETAPTRSRIRLYAQTTAEGITSGFWEVRVCIKGVGCDEAVSPVPPTPVANGGWSLEIEITDGGDGELGGGARVEFGDGSECYYSVDGRYSESKDTARLSLAPTEPDCEGTSLKLKDVRPLNPLRGGMPDDISGSISYRLFGVRGATEFGDLPPLFVPQQPFPVSGGAQVSGFSWALLMFLTSEVEVGSGPRPGEVGASATITVIGLP